MLRFLTLLALTATLGAMLPASPARAELLPDSTTASSWRLANGLEVRARSIPGARGVAVAIAYRAGALCQSSRREGMAELLAELQFTSAAGSLPERTRREMSSLRPMGWSVRVNDHLAVLTEVASVAQFPGVLRQVSQRAQGVQAGDSSLARAVRAVRSDYAEQRFGDVENSLYYRVRDLARGLDDSQVLRNATGESLRGVTLAEVQAELARLYVPANATLALVGDFSALDLRALVEREFGPIPGGHAQRDTAVAALHAGVRTSVRDSFTSAFGVIGVLSPPIDDPRHPAFYLTSLLLGPYWAQQLQGTQTTLSSFFSYSLFDEPDLARFYVVGAAGLGEAGQMLESWRISVSVFGTQLMEAKDYEAVKANVSWLLGAPLPRALLRQSRRDSGVLATIAFSAATRATWRGDAFWDAYRSSFLKCRTGNSAFVPYLADPKNQAVLLLTPKP